MDSRQIKKKELKGSRDKKYSFFSKKNAEHKGETVAEFMAKGGEVKVLSPEGSIVETKKWSPERVIEAMNNLDSKVGESGDRYAHSFQSIELCVLGAKVKREDHLTLLHAIDNLVNNKTLKRFGPPNDTGLCSFMRLK